jgi:glyoxylase I family protein
VKEAEVGFDVQAVHHLTLRVSDLPRSRRFYEGVLGFAADQAWEDKCRLRLGSTPDATLLVLRPPLTGTPANDRFSERRIGLDHIAMAVKSRNELERVVAALRDAGIVTEGIQAVPGGGALVCFRDPDNIQLEFFCDEAG